jgi:hypothetical protein
VSGAPETGSFEQHLPADPAGVQNAARASCMLSKTACVHVTIRQLNDDVRMPSAKRGKISCRREFQSAVLEFVGLLWYAKQTRLCLSTSRVVHSAAMQYLDIILNLADRGI